jgi:ribonuclease P protein component
MAVGRLKRRQDFLRVAAAQRKCATPSLVLQARPAPEDARITGPRPRVGFTASRKVGGEVQRNRARRRLRAAVTRIMPAHAAADHDYVVIARAGTLTRAFPALVGDLETALRRLGTFRDGGTRAGREA